MPRVEMWVCRRGLRWMERVRLRGDFGWLGDTCQRSWQEGSMEVMNKVESHWLVRLLKPSH